MRKYLIKAQSTHDERSFDLVDVETGITTYNVDIYTDGKLPDFPVGADSTPQSWREWLGTFVGKHIEVETITPSGYFTMGETRIVD